jgi:Protein of Unknown function (DUF2784)
LKTKLVQAKRGSRFTYERNVYRLLVRWADLYDWPKGFGENSRCGNYGRHAALAWVRDWRWRLLHLIAIAVIAAESIFGIDCPLTVWEDRLRGEQTSTGFIERWIDRILFYDAPTWVFTAAYIGFAALVVITWIAVPPTKDPRNPATPK